MKKNIAFKAILTSLVYNPYTMTTPYSGDLWE